MEPTYPNEQQQGQTNQDILDALGGSLPRVELRKKPSKTPLFVAAGVFVAILIIIGVLVSLPKSAEEEQQVEATISAEFVVGGIEMIKDFTAIISSGNYAVAQAAYTHPLSILEATGLNQQTLANIAGEGLDWSTCEPAAQTTYEATQLEELDGLEYNVAYIPVTCNSKDEDITNLEFDIRKSTDYDWRIYNIVMRTI